MKHIGKKVKNNIQYKVMPMHSKSLGRRDKATLFPVSVSDVFERIVSFPAPLYTPKAYAINVKQAPEPF
jgi:hypothetical protein